MGKTVFAVIFALLVSTSFVSAQDRVSGKSDPLYRASQALVVAGLVVDMTTTVVSMRSSTIVNYSYCVDGTQSCVQPNQTMQITTFSEKGWARIAGKNNVAGVVVLNVLADAGVLTVSHFLHEKGGTWRYAAIGLNVFAAGNRLAAGVGNAQRLRSARIVPAGAFNITW